MLAIYPLRVYNVTVKKNTPMGFVGYKRGVFMEEKKACPGCSHKTKERSEKEYKDLINRLSRIEGQVRGIRWRRMPTVRIS